MSHLAVLGVNFNLEVIEDGVIFSCDEFNLAVLALGIPLFHFAGKFWTWNYALTKIIINVETLKVLKTLSLYVRMCVFLGFGWEVVKNSSSGDSSGSLCLLS